MAYNHKKLREEIDNYNDTVWATVAFTHECKWDEGKRAADGTVKFGFGRPMIRPDEKEVTPDVVVQRRADQGIVAEVKHTFPPADDPARRDIIFDQLKKYDSDLRGWWTPQKTIPRHDLVLLTHDSHVIDAVDHLTRDLAGKEIGTFERNLAIIGYSRKEQSELYFSMKKEHGSLLDGQLTEKFRRSVQIAVRHLILERQVRFCDSAPPVPLMLQLLWEQVFPELASQIERNKEKGYTPIPVTVDSLTRTLQLFFGNLPEEGNRGIPQGEWVANALEMLGSLRMAHKDEGAGAHIIRYKAIHGDVLQRFGRLCYEHLEKKKSKSKKLKSGQIYFDFAPPE